MEEKRNLEINFKQEEALFLSAIDEHIERFKRRASNKEKLRYLKLKYKSKK